MPIPTAYGFPYPIRYIGPPRPDNWTLPQSGTTPAPPDLPGTPIPAGLAQFYLWGGGGAGTKRNPGYRAGAGGYTRGQLTLVAGNVYVIRVGGGGNYNTGQGGFGGGGNAQFTANSSDGGAGGGLSGVFVSEVTQANARLIAGGGGGASGDPQEGGLGGGATGQDAPLFGTPWRRGGGGGTQVAGGAAGTSGGAGTSGTALQGGSGATGSTPGAGGGGGYFGGGGGSFAGPGPGGGGSGHLHPSVVNGLTTRWPSNDGSTYNPNSVPDLPSSNVGVGGEFQASGNPGAVILADSTGSRFVFSTPGDYVIHGV